MFTCRVVLAVVIGSGCSSATTLKGLVQSSSGARLARVQVDDLLGNFDRAVYTSPTGEFTVSLTSRAILLFTHFGHKATVRMVPPGTSSLNVVLDPVDSGVWSPQLCSRSGEAFNGRMSFHWPHGAVSQTDADYSNTVYQYPRHGDRRFALEAWEMAILSDRRPGKGWANEAVEATVRSLRCGELDGFDLRAVKADGSRGRFVSYLYGYVFYTDVPPEVAKRFDKIIDSACCR